MFVVTGFIKTVLLASSVVNLSSASTGFADSVRGALLGVVIGDAAGAPLECPDNLSPQEKAKCYKPGDFAAVKNALSFPGANGPMYVAPAQPTDDSEMTFMLLQAIIQNRPKSKQQYPQLEAFNNYAFWCNKSNSFGRGDTTKNALSKPLGFVKNNRSPNDKASNGSLMRIAPIGMLYSRLTDEQIADIAREDSVLTHGSFVSGDACAVYSVAMACLVRTGGNAQQCIAHTQNYINRHIATLRPEIVGYFNDALKPQLPGNFNVNHQQGNVRYAFTLAFHHLNKRTPFYKAIQSILSLGGDSDTNAAIAGGLLGAMHGESNIDTYMIKEVLNFDPTAVRNPKRVRATRFGLQYNYQLLNDWLSGKHPLTSDKTYRAGQGVPAQFKKGGGRAGGRPAPAPKLAGAGPQQQQRRAPFRRQQARRGHRAHQRGPARPQGRHAGTRRQAQQPRWIRHAGGAGGQL